MEPTKELIDALYHEEVRSARRQAWEDKLRAGAELFDFACEVTRSGIRQTHPHASDEELEHLLEARIDLGRRLEAHR